LKVQLFHCIPSVCWRLPIIPSDYNCTAGAGCRSVLVRQFLHLAAKLADREAPTQGSSSSNSATNARSYLSQYMTDLQLPVQSTAAEYWQQ